MDVYLRHTLHFNIVAEVPLKPVMIYVSGKDLLLTKIQASLNDHHIRPAESISRKKLSS